MKKFLLLTCFLLVFILLPGCSIKTVDKKVTVVDCKLSRFFLSTEMGSSIKILEIRVAVIERPSDDYVIAVMNPGNQLLIAIGKLEIGHEILIDCRFSKFSLSHTITKIMKL